MTHSRGRAPATSSRSRRSPACAEAPAWGIYSATKAPRFAFIESLRTEFIGTGLHASVIYPVTTPTEFRDVMERDFGYASSGRGLLQPVEDVCRRHCTCASNAPRAEVYPKRGTTSSRIVAALTPRLMDKFMRKFDRRSNPGT
jgi:short-subunit dehydrogenase